MDPALEFRLIRRPERPPEHERHPQRARRSDGSSLLANQAHLRGRDAFALGVVAQCADGARAIGSDRRQEQRVDAVLLEQRSKLASFGLKRADRRGPHERIMEIRD